MKILRIIFVLIPIITMPLQAESQCAARHSELTVMQALEALKSLIAAKPLTDNDKAMIETIILARLEGRMLKIAPNFSDNGSEVYMHIITQSEQLGGFETFKGAAYGVELLKLTR